MVLLAPWPAVAQRWPGAGPQPLRHAAWIGHGWVNGTPTQAVPQLLSHLAANGVTSLMVNMGRLNESGWIEDPAVTLERWLDQVRLWEESNGQPLELWAWMSAKTFRTDIVDQKVRTRIADEARRLAAIRSPGGRGFDGIITDIEPVGLEPSRYEAYIQLVDEMRQAVGAGHPIGIAAPRFSPEPQTEWFWGTEEFARMARHADFIVVNTYNTALRDILGVTGDDYAEWIANQTRAVLAAVAGEDGNPDRPPPRDGFRLFISAPAYPPLVHESGSISHDPGIENTRYALRGIRSAVERLRAAGAPELRYLAGVALYGHTDGTGADGYAALDQDWLWWAEELNAPAPAPLGQRPREAAWLGPEWAAGQRPGEADRMLDLMDALDVQYLLLHMGALDTAGQVPVNAEALQRLLSEVQAWERSRGERMVLWAWLPGQMARTDIRQEAIRDRIAAEAERILSVQGPGGRRVEGVLLDLSPMNQDRNLLTAYTTLLDEIHRRVGWRVAVGAAGFPYVPDAPGQGNWDPLEFYYMGLHADFIIARLHGGPPQTSEVRRMLTALSGEHWTPARPGPRPHLKVFFSTPARAANLVRAAAAGVDPTGAARAAALGRGLALQAGADGWALDAHALLTARIHAEENSRSLYERLIKVERVLGWHQDFDTYVQDRKVAWDVRPLAENGRTLVPLRQLSEAMGAAVSWSQEHRRVTVTAGGRLISLTVDHPAAEVNGRQVSLDVPPRVIDGRVVIPLRFISEQMGWSVTWLEPYRTIVVTRRPLH